MRSLPISFIVLVVMALSGCKTWDISQLSPTNAPISSKLPALEESTQGIINSSEYQDKQDLFNAEVEQNLMIPYGEKYGYIILQTNTGDIKMGNGFSVVSGLTLFIANLIGIPFSRTKIELEATVEILNSRKELIGKYRAIGKGQGIAALYYGYAVKNTFRKAYADALKNALSQIRPQIQTDAGRLSSELKKTGQINN